MNELLPLLVPEAEAVGCTLLSITRKEHAYDIKVACEGLVEESRPDSYWTRDTPESVLARLNGLLERFVL